MYIHINMFVYLLYRHECFTVKYTARKIHMKLHPGPEWDILTSEVMDDVISHFCTVFSSETPVCIIKRGARS